MNAGARGKGTDLKETRIDPREEEKTGGRQRGEDQGQGKTNYA